MTEKTIGILLGPIAGSRWSVPGEWLMLRRVRRPVALLLVLGLGPLFLMSLFAQSPPEGICPGDVNLDGGRGPGDMALLSSHLAGEQFLAGRALTNADVNRDAVVDVGDLARLLQHTTKELPLVPCGEYTLREVPCPLVRPAKTAALPLEDVGIGILPEEFAEAVAAFVVTEDGQLSVVTPVERQENGSAALFTPFYPGGALEGGGVTLLVTDGNAACSPIGFSIEAIPTAPGEFLKLVEVIREGIRSSAARMGLSEGTLLAAGPNLSPEAIPLALGWRLLDDPDNPGDSLRGLGGGSFLGSDVDSTFLDAAVARLQIVALLEESFEGGSIQERPQGEVSDPSQLTGSPRLVDLNFCGDSAAELSDCMRDAVLAERQSLFYGGVGQGPAQRKILEDTNKSLNVALTVAGHGLTNLLVRKLADQYLSNLGVFLALDIARLAQEALAHLLPSRLTHLDLRLVPASMEEDREDGIAEVMLSASSKGWKLDARRIVQEAFEQLDASAKLESAPVALLRELAESSLTHESISLPKETSTKELENKLVDFVVEKGEKHFPGYFKGSVLEIEPRTFGPVPLFDPYWKENRVLGSAIQFRGGGSNVYEPVKVGSARVITRVRTDDGQFGGVPSISAAKPIEVKRIILNVSPSEVVVKPGEKVDFIVSVENSFFAEEIEVTAERGEVLGTEYLGNSRHRVSYKAPPMIQRPDILTAVHTGTTGARRFSTEPRLAQATIRNVSVVVTPETICLAPGSRQTFTARMVGIEDQKVSWSWAASGGAIGKDDGVLKAPDSDGVVVVTATSLVDQNLTGTAVVKVGGCECWWAGWVGGNLFSSQSGDTGLFVHVPEGQLTISLQRPGGESLAIRIDDPASPGMTDVAGANFALAPPDTAFDSPNVSGGLIEFSDKLVEGAFFGPVSVYWVTGSGEVESRLEPFSVRFRITEDPELIFFPIGKGCNVQ
ncbi:MAG: dockerin type I repeat-containing protein [Acidobacteriota bacterium]|nr:MAG: dockerin type I repeat-containing protein [Acidobacteriota bacterium]